MLTGIGTPTAWPFFHAGHSAIATRLALGTAIDSGFTTIQVDGINLATGDLLLCATASDNASSATTVAVTIGPNAMTQDVAVVSTVTLLVTVNSYVAIAPIVGATCLATWTVNDPDNQCMLVCKVSNVVGTLVNSRSGGFANTTSPNSGATAFGAASRFHWGIVGTIGQAADSLGVWQSTTSEAGQRISSNTVRIDLKEAYRYTNLAAGRARILNQTSRQSAAIIARYA
jgi:hypothetical protein